MFNGIVKASIMFLIITAVNGIVSQDVISLFAGWSTWWHLEVHLLGGSELLQGIEECGQY